jgi:hypothetical protein
MTRLVPILLCVALSALCFVVAFNHRARRFMVSLSVWRYGNDEQKRLMETFTAVVMVLVAIGLIVFCFYLNR